MTHTRFSEFERILLDRGAAAVRHRDTLISQDPPYEVFYIPFEHVNRGARLVIVGITPGMNQLEMAYAEAQRLLKNGISQTEILEAVKTLASFGGAAMRPNLLRMLRHFKFATILGIADEGDLWGTAAGLLHSTSVVPHAAFKSGKMFSGNFNEILQVEALRVHFESDFVPSLSELPHNALYLALGNTPFEALRHCVRLGVINEQQLIGALAHPSRSGGSQVAVYLGEKVLDDLDPKDPVRPRVDWLRNAYAAMQASTSRLQGSRPKTVSPLSTPMPNSASPITRSQIPVRNEINAVNPTASLTSDLHYRVGRGKAKGTVLRPHIQDGYYIVSPTRFEADYVRVPMHEPLEPHLKRGLSLRMSAPGVTPSLISPNSILGRD